MSKIEDSEIFSRWIYCPRYVDESNNFNDNYTSLRKTINEEGISGQIYNRAGKEAVMKSGLEFIRKNKKGVATEAFVGVGLAEVISIRQLSVEPDTIDVIEVPSTRVPHHAEIRFWINGIPSFGQCQNPRLLYYFYELKKLMSKDVVEYGE